jgi:molybdate transport system regulatory protein
MARAKSMKHLKAVVKLNIKPPKSEGMGARACVVCSGLIKILRMVEDNGAIYGITKSEGMTYTKAWVLLNNTERELGYPLVKRNGAHGSTLTSEGRKLLEIYETLIAKLNEVADAELARLVADGGGGGGVI